MKWEKMSEHDKRKVWGNLEILLSPPDKEKKEKEEKR